MDLIAFPAHFLALHAYLLLLCVTTALLEIQIEGKNGWAAKLPTWRYTPTWLKPFANGKDVTGYHTFLISTLLLLVHLPVMFLGWSWYLEWTILSLYCSYSLLWDALWFVFNPAYGFANFRKGNVWWYSRWWGRFPADYYQLIALGFAFALFRGMSAGAAADPRLAPLPVPLQHALGWLLGAAFGIACVGVLAASHMPRKERFFSIAHLHTLLRGLKLRH